MHQAAKFSRNFQDLLVIYKAFIRSKLEQSASVWHSSLSKCNEDDLERVQKSALSNFERKEQRLQECISVAKD